MLRATEAIELSRTGAEETKRDIALKAAQKSEKWNEDERKKNPERIRGAEASVRAATRRGERKADTGIYFTEGVDYLAGDEDFEFGSRILMTSRLCSAHQELLQAFHDAGYTLLLEPDFEPDRASWYQLHLEW